MILTVGQPVPKVHWFDSSLAAAGFILSIRLTNPQVTASSIEPTVTAVTYCEDKT
jgi:hypothetical protein